MTIQAGPPPSRAGAGLRLTQEQFQRLGEILWLHRFAAKT